MTEFTFFSRTHKTLNKISHMADEGTSLNNFQKLKYMSKFTLTTIELIWTSIKISLMSPNCWNILNIFLENSLNKKEIRMEIRKYFKLNNNKQLTKMDGMLLKQDLKKNA